MEIEHSRLQSIIVTMKHARTFISSREKMHPTGIELYDDLLNLLQRLASQPKNTADGCIECKDGTFNNVGWCCCPYCGAKVRR